MADAADVTHELARSAMNWRNAPKALVPGSGTETALGGGGRKKRAVCPSCAGRRMANEAASLVVHFHTYLLDGVYAPDASGELVFHEAARPTREDLERVVRVVRERAIRWLRRHGHLERSALEERSNEAPQLSPIEACAAIATQRGTTRTFVQDADPASLGDYGVGAEGPTRQGGAVDLDGFNLHASVRIAAQDDLGRERLMRYGARPPFSLDRFRRLDGGLVAYRMKKLGARRAKHRVMTPLELLARLAALVPPPRYPLVRFHGVLAPHSAWRAEIIPRPPRGSSVPLDTDAHEGNKRRSSTRPRCGDADSPRGAPSIEPDRPPRRLHASSTAPARLRKGDDAPAALARTLPLAGDNATPAVTSLTPNILGVRHWARLLGGLLYANSPRLRWPQLLQRSFSVDVLECPTCRGRIRVLEAIVDPSRARQILEQLAIPVDAPRAARARDPTTLYSDEPDAA